MRMDIETGVLCPEVYPLWVYSQIIDQGQGHWVYRKEVPSLCGILIVLYSVNGVFLVRILPITAGHQRYRQFTLTRIIGKNRKHSECRILTKSRQINKPSGKPEGF